MRIDIDRLMEMQDLNALWVCGNLYNNPDMVYFTGIHHVNNADLFKLRGKEPIIFHPVSMESEEAAKSGLESHAYFSEKPLSAYLKKRGGNPIEAFAERIKDAMREIGFTSGRAAISGIVELSERYETFKLLDEMLPDIEFASFLKESPIGKARMTKSTDEIDHIRQIGAITTAVMKRVQHFLQSQSVKNDQLVFPDGIPITIGDIKNRIRRWLAELGADNPEDTIFAIGRDAGIPHSSGNSDDVIEMGKPIVFDIFPCEAGGGYFYDITRSWCLGYASEEVKKIHQQVLEVHHRIIEELQPGQPFKKYQSRTCELFADMGHTTIGQDETTTSGYMHSIGHGVGLHVHEKPFSGITAAPDDDLIPGVVFTIEPGLYYADKEMGIRIEDTIYLNEDGSFNIVAEYPYDLILPVNK